MEVVEIEILNWKKFNGKETLKTPNWFKVHIGIGASKSLFGLPFSTKWIWICVLAEAKREKCPKIRLNLKWASNYWAIEKKLILEAMESFKEIGLLRVNSESPPSALRSNSSSERERERERDNTVVFPETTPSEKNSFDLEEIYKKYPKRPEGLGMGKAPGMRKFQKIVKSQTDFERVRRSVENYSLWVEKFKKQKFVMMWSTFAGQWEDWENGPQKENQTPAFDFGDRYA